MLQSLLMSVPTGFRDVALIFLDELRRGFENVRGLLTVFEVSMLQSDLDRRHLLSIRSDRGRYLLVFVIT